MVQSLAGISSLAAQSLGIGARGGSIADAIAKALEFSGSGQQKARNPRDTIEISDAARAKLKKAQADKAIVERLIEDLDKLSGKKTAVRFLTPRSSQTVDSAPTPLPAVNEGANSSSTASVGASAGVTNIKGIDEDLFTQGLYNLQTGAMLARKPGSGVTKAEEDLVYAAYSDSYGMDGIGPNVKRSYEYAIKNKTLIIQHAEDVPGLNYRLNASAIVNSSGVIMEMRSMMTYNADVLMAQKGFANGVVQDGREGYVTFIQGFGGALITWKGAPSESSDRSTSEKTTV